MIPRDPPDTLSGAAAGVEKPRIYAGGEDKLRTLTALGPPEGVIFVHLYAGKVMQWQTDHWEVVAEKVVGLPPFSEDRHDDRAPGTPWVSSNPPGSGYGGNAGGGGGGISPAPHQVNDPSLTTPMAGGSPSPFFNIVGNGTDTTLRAVGATGGFVDYNTVGPVTPPANGHGVIGVMVGTVFDAPKAAGDATLQIRQDGVVRASSTNGGGAPSSLQALWLPTHDTFVVPGVLTNITARIINNTGAPFNVQSYQYMANIMSIQYV